MGTLAKSGGLEKIHGDEKLSHGISGLLNAISKLSVLAKKYGLEGDLYHPMRGLAKVLDLMAPTKERRFLRKNPDLDMGHKDKWNKIVQFLEKELRGVPMCIANAKSNQNLFSNSERPGNAEKSTKFGLYGWDETTYHKVGVGMDKKPICDICGKNDHKTYVTTYQ